MEKQKGVQVIGAGMPRTGTSSLQAALQILGYAPCHHMVSDVLGDVQGRAQRWSKAWKTKDKVKRHALIREILSPYRAVVDFPASIMIDDMIEVYPDAKVILGIRSSPEAWRKSFSKTLDITVAPWWVACTFMLPATRFLVWDCVPWWEKINKERYDAQVYRTSSTDVYVRHNEYVRKVVRKENLLEFQPDQGWKPLCDFLGVPIPDQPYPRLFEARENRKWFYLGAVIGVAMWMIGIGGCVGLWYAIRFVQARAGKTGVLEL